MTEQVKTGSCGKFTFEDRLSYYRFSVGLSKVNGKFRKVFYITIRLSAYEAKKLDMEARDRVCFSDEGILFRCPDSKLFRPNATLMEDLGNGVKYQAKYLTQPENWPGVCYKTTHVQDGICSPGEKCSPPCDQGFQRKSKTHGRGQIIGKPSEKMLKALEERGIRVFGHPRLKNWKKKGIDPEILLQEMENEVGCFHDHTTAETKESDNG